MTSAASFNIVQQLWITLYIGYMYNDKQFTDISYQMFSRKLSMFGLYFIFIYGRQTLQ
jgi:hypothetical protein